MSEMMTIADNRCAAQGRAVERFAVGLSLTGVLAVGLTAMFSRISVPIERPWVLAIASAFLLVPVREHRVVLLQKVVGLYLIAVLFNQVFAQYVTISIASQRISISRSVGPFLLCALGAILMWRRPHASADTADQSPLLRAWLIAFAIIITHMLVLALLLHHFYGYGYENNFRVLAHLSLHFLLFLVLMRSLDHYGFRILSGLALIVTYTILGPSP